MLVKITYPTSYNRHQMMLLVHCLSMGFGQNYQHDELNHRYLVELDNTSDNIDLNYLSDYFSWVDIETDYSR
ncbi:hypothetical protein L2750_12120 [Shewanella submarina]|uniref:Uncharacterized protein n=1 Tax=Shewanella submarina TaxID=2016376 RepID=A0ABV7GI65_9GAMM|nr:hypothetical protein [Shewanella submarina]MCL1037897.1 hypothetical protein [Shewanella submarina]